jgi:hypothetical protein
MNLPLVTTILGGLAAFALTALPADALSNPLVVDLHRVNAPARDGSATIFGSQAGVLVNVTASGALPNGAAISLNSGSCRNPGNVSFALADLNGGASLTQLKHSLADIAGRAKSMVVHQSGRLDSAPFACGDISG